MPDALEVELKVTGLDKAERDIYRFSRELRDLRDIRLDHLGSGMSSSAASRYAQTQQAAQRQQQSREYQERQQAKRERELTGRGSGFDIAPFARDFTRVLGEFAGPVGLAASAVSLLADASRSASAEMKAFRAAQYIGGGNKYETALVQFQQ